MGGDLEPDPPGTILLVEDNPAYTRLVQELLHEAGLDTFEMEWTDTLQDAHALLDETPRVDLVLLDLLLPDNLGTDTLRSMLEHANGTPIVVLTGIDDDDLAREALDLGAVDYLCKGRLDADRLSQAVQRGLQDRTSGTLETDPPDTDTARALPVAAERLEDAASALDTAHEHLDPLAPPDVERRLAHEKQQCAAVAEGLHETQDLLKQEITHEHVHLKDVLDDALVRLSAHGPSGGQVRLGWEATPTVKGDRARLTRLFELLIGQLLARPTTDASNLTITAQRADGAWTVTITDQAPPPKAPDPLDALFRARSPTEPLPGPLAHVLCQALVDAHEGTLRLAPDENGPGTALTLTLPAAPVTEPRKARQDRQGDPTKSL